VNPALAERYFSREEIDRAKSYHRPMYGSFAVSTVISLGYLAALAFSSVGRWLAAAVDDLPRWAYVLSYVAIVVVLGALLRFPLSLWRGYVHEHRWRFSTQSIGGWLIDWLKSTAVTVVLTALPLLVLIELASALHDAWPLAAAPAAAALVFFLSFVAPVVLEPVFNRFRPLEDPAIVEDLRALAARAHVPIRDVLVADASRRTRKENAYVSGLGKTRRVVVFDTLLKRGSPRELRLVAAHELGHRRDRHVVWMTLLGALGSATVVVLLWALLRWDAVLSAISSSGPSDPRIVPYVLLVAGAVELLGLPFGTTISRRWERAADRASIELTGDPEGFVEMERNLAVSNLIDLDPPRALYALLFTHPTPPERIAAAEHAEITLSPTTG
jgi:STE24 endopeptidase